MHKSKNLVTLKDWQDEARAKQLTFWDAQQAPGTLPTYKAAVLLEIRNRTQVPWEYPIAQPKCYGHQCAEN